MKVIISHTARELLLKDVYNRRQIEACGVLIGSRDEQDNWHVEQIQPLNNSANSPVYFEFYPEELLAVELNYPDQLVGVYHSHPTGYARASKTDRENMQRVNQDEGIPWVWLIVCGPFSGESSEASPTILAYYHEQNGLQHIEITDNLE